MYLDTDLSLEARTRSAIVHCPFIIFVSFFGAVWTFGSTVSGQPAQPRTFTEIIADHPIPDLHDLTERSKPGVRDPNVSMLSFYDLLKLRTVGTAEAIPVLEQVMQDHLLSTTRIHGFAAAQALFCIDTPEAHDVLQRYLFDDRYNTQLGINYTFYWEMSEPQRSAFIEQYYLKNCSKTLQIDLATGSETVNGIQTLTITATLLNTSQKSYRICDYPFAFGDYLYFRAQSGRFIHNLMTSTCCTGPEKWFELKPGETKQYQTKMQVATADQLGSFRRYLKNGNLWLKEDHSNAFLIENPGQFQVYALFERSPLNKETIERLGFDDVWIGRAVSKPAIVTVEPAR